MLPFQKKLTQSILQNMKRKYICSQKYNISTCTDWEMIKKLALFLLLKQCMQKFNILYQRIFNVFE